MIKKVLDMEKDESGIIENFSGYQNELECMGLTRGCSIVVKSDKSDKIKVISLIKKPDNDIILLNSVASEITVKISDPKKEL